MSFIKDGVTYKEILDTQVLGLATSNYIWVCKSSGVVGYMPNTVYAPSTHAHSIISHAVSAERFECTGSFNLIKCESPSQPVYFKTGGSNVSTSPSGNGTSIYADAFVQHCMKRLKNKIVDLPPDAIDKAKLLKPRAYELANGKPGIGFVSEETPTELRQQAINVETGVPEEGIDVMALCAYQQMLLVNLEQRLTTLEKNK